MFFLYLIYICIYRCSIYIYSSQNVIVVTVCLHCVKCKCTFIVYIYSLLYYPEICHFVYVWIVLYILSCLYMDNLHLRKNIHVWLYFYFLSLRLQPLIFLFKVKMKFKRILSRGILQRNKGHLFKLSKLEILEIMLGENFSGYSSACKTEYLIKLWKT